MGYETRAYVFTSDTRALSCTLLPVLKRHPVLRCARVVVSDDAPHGWWRELRT